MKQNLLTWKAALMVVATIFVIGCGKDEKNGSGNGGGGVPPSIQVTDSGSIYGTWGGFPTMTFGDVKIKFTLTFQPGWVTNSAICEVDGLNIHTSVKAPAEITGNQIRILEPRENVTHKYGANCRASLEVGTLGYEMQGANSVKFYRNGEMAVLTRM